MPTENEFGPEQGQPSNEGNQPLDFERAYGELRPEYTRATQELSQARQSLSDFERLFDALADPETQAEALAYLGFEMDTGSGNQQENNQGEELWEDPLEKALNAQQERLDRLEARELEASNAQAEAEILELRDALIGDEITFIEEQRTEQSGREFTFTEREESVLGNLAIAMSDEYGVPDVEGAYKALYGDDGVLETNRQRWIDTKRPAAFAPNGTTIPADRKPQTPRERVAYIDERIRAEEDSY